MQVQVEFLGLARQRAGCPAVTLKLPGRQTSLAAILEELAQRLPALGCELESNRQLAPHWTVCVDGERFVRDPATVVRDGQCVWVLSADAGG